jgi:hypothetical protein
MDRQKTNAKSFFLKKQEWNESLLKYIKTNKC